MSRWTSLVAAGVLYRQMGRADGPAPYLVPLTATPGSETYPSFSPDGDQIAFAWNGEKGDNWDIYVKMIGSTESRRLTTDPASDSFPAWSPDGRSIAFVRAASGATAGSVHVVSPLGGSDRKLSDQPVAQGLLSWSPDGRWLATAAHSFADEVRSEIRGVRLVDASSGDVRLITAPEGTSYHTAAVFSPDGRHLAHLSCRGRFSCQVDVVDLGADSTPKSAARHLTTKTVWPRGLAWVRDGRSVVYGGGSAWRLSRVEIDGGASPTQVAIAGFGAFSPATAVSRDRLAFMRSGVRFALGRFEVGRPPEDVAPSSSVDRLPHFSPDGRRFAFESQRAGGWSEIWLAGVDGSNPTQLTHRPGLWQGSPRWSPDGRRVASDSFAADGQWDVWTIDADGGPPRRLTSDPADENLPSWSQDGRFVYFSSNRTGAETIWRVPALGGSEEQVARTGGGRSQEAADGRTLFYQRASRGSSPLLAVSPAGGSERTVLDCVPRFGYAAGAAGVYHLACGNDAHGAPLLLLDPATGRDRLLGTLERPGEGLAASPDGKTILYTKVVGEGSDLVLIENFR